MIVSNLDFCLLDIKSVHNKMCYLEEKACKQQPKTIFFYCCSSTVVSIFPPPFPPPHPSPLLTLNPTPLGFVLVSFIHVPENPSAFLPHHPLPPPLWLLLVCS